MTMGRDSSSASSGSVSIPVVFITMSEFKTLKVYINESESSNSGEDSAVALMVFSRADPYEYLPTFILFAIAVSTIAVGASSIGRQERLLCDPDPSPRPAHKGGQSDGPRPSAATAATELKMWHAVVFILHCAMLLTLLYFFDLNKIVTYIYIVFATISMSAMFFYPVMTKLYRLLADRYSSSSSSSSSVPERAQVISDEYIIEVAKSPVFALAIILSLGIMLTWAFNRLTSYIMHT